jgi:hypothetical protein
MNARSVTSSAGPILSPTRGTVPPPRPPQPLRGQAVSILGIFSTRRPALTLLSRPASGETDAYLPAATSSRMTWRIWSRVGVAVMMTP